MKENIVPEEPHNEICVHACIITIIVGTAGTAHIEEKEVVGPAHQEEEKEQARNKERGGVTEDSPPR